MKIQSAHPHNSMKHYCSKVVKQLHQAKEQDQQLSGLQQMIAFEQNLDFMQAQQTQNSFKNADNDSAQAIILTAEQRRGSQESQQSQQSQKHFTELKDMQGWLPRTSSVGPITMTHNSKIGLYSTVENNHSSGIGPSPLSQAQWVQHGSTLMQPAGIIPHLVKRNPKHSRGRDSTDRLPNALQNAEATPDRHSQHSRDSLLLPQTSQSNFTQLQNQTSADNIFAELLKQSHENGIYSSAHHRQGSLAYQIASESSTIGSQEPNFQMLSAIQSYSLALTGESRVGSQEGSPTRKKQKTMTLLGHQFVKQQQSKSNNYGANITERSKLLAETLEKSGFSRQQVVEIKRAVKEKVNSNPGTSGRQMKVVENKNFPMPQLNQFVPIVQRKTGDFTQELQVGSYDVGKFLSTSTENLHSKSGCGNNTKRGEVTAFINQNKLPSSQKVTVDTRGHSEIAYAAGKNPRKSKLKPAAPKSMEITELASPTEALTSMKRNIVKRQQQLNEEISYEEMMCTPTTLQLNPQYSPGGGFNSSKTFYEKNSSKTREKVEIPRPKIDLPQQPIHPPIVKTSQPRHAIPTKRTDFDEETITKNDAHNSKFSSLRQPTDKGLRFRYQAMGSTANISLVSMREAAQQNMTTTMRNKRQHLEKLPSIGRNMRQEKVPSVLMSARSSLELKQDSTGVQGVATNNSSRQQLANLSPVRPTETSHRKEARQFSRYLQEQVPLAVIPKTRNTTGVNASKNKPAQSRLKPKTNSRLISTNANSQAYSSAMAGSTSKVSQVIGHNKKAFNTIFERKMSTGGLKTQGPLQLAQSFNRHGEQQARLSQDLSTDRLHKGEKCYVVGPIGKTEPKRKLQVGLQHRIDSERQLESLMPGSKGVRTGQMRGGSQLESAIEEKAQNSLDMHTRSIHGSGHSMGSVKEELKSGWRRRIKGNKIVFSSIGEALNIVVAGPSRDKNIFIELPTTKGSGTSGRMIPEKNLMTVNPDLGTLVVKRKPKVREENVQKLRAAIFQEHSAHRQASPAVHASSQQLKV